MNRTQGQDAKIGNAIDRLEKMKAIENRGGPGGHEWHAVPGWYVTPDGVEYRGNETATDESEAVT